MSAAPGEVATAGQASPRRDMRQQSAKCQPTGATQLPLESALGGLRQPNSSNALWIFMYRLL